MSRRQTEQTRELGPGLQQPAADVEAACVAALDDQGLLAEFAAPRQAVTGEELARAERVWESTIRNRRSANSRLSLI